MSDAPGGPDWWQANDDKWYPPQQRPDAPDNRPPPPTPSPEAAAATKRKDAGNGCLIMLGLGAAVLLLGWGCTALAGGNDTSYVASVDYEVANPASITVFVEVTNTGDEAGTPDCTVRASDPSNAYSGFDVFTLEETIAPGETSRFSGSIVVTGQGAAFVTEASAECE